MNSRLVRKQLAFMLGRQQIFLELEEDECEDSEDLTDIMSNVHLNNNFLALGREVCGGGRKWRREEGVVCVSLCLKYLLRNPTPSLSLSSSSPPQLDIMEPKIPEDIYKSHLEHTRKP